MGDHNVYRSIVCAVKEGRLKEPFGNKEFAEHCPGFCRGTYNAFLYKHRREKGNTTELFERVAPGRFILIRPFRYDL